MEHRTNEEREHCRKHTSQESIGCHSTRRILLKSVDEVVQCSLEDGKEAETHQNESDKGRDPEYALEGCPAKDK